MGHRSSGDGSRKCGKDVQLYLIMISKILDGFSDPIAGQLIDTHRSKRGHCIPVLLKWTLPMVNFFGGQQMQSA